MRAGFSRNPTAHLLPTMLRPATPLSILFFVAFCLLLLSTISTPIIPAIPIATYRNINFGVLGYCPNGGACKGPMIGYDTGMLLKMCL